jgi:hypothetical protein
MSEYGIKIKNFQAGSLYGYNIGIRDRLDSTNAMLTNSLFSDFLKENGLTVWKNESTRDVICIEFEYGSRSYKEELKHLDKMEKDINEDSVLSKIEKNEKKEVVSFLRDRTNLNKDKYSKKSAEELRILFYTKGVDVKYQTHNKKGEVIKEEVIHYKMLYRTPGKAKKGSCMFINEKLYDVARNFLYMGIKLPKENSPIVEIGAYSSLITSSIVGKVQILPEQILVLKDVDAFFNTKIISVETDENKHCKAISKDNYQVKNTLFDGQALIDTSIFPTWGEGYILLRHHMCKMAAFHSNIQTFMKDYFKEDYETATVEDMWGNKVKVSDIKLITTDNAMKWLKFDVSYDYWCDWVKANNSMFGIVKTAHRSKLGEVQRMSYQMINALDIDIMPQVVQCSMDYIEQLKTNDDVFLDYLRDNTNFSNDYEVLVALVEQDRDFLRSEYFRDRKKFIIQSYVLNFKNGKIIQNADNLVIVGSPYAMLLHAVGENALNDNTFLLEQDTIQCYTERFEDGEYLAEFRSPFNSKNNMGYLHNVYHSYFKKYFNFGKQIIAVNMIGTDFQDRNNGSDQDSDSIYTTNQSDIVKYAKYCYLNYPTIVNNIPKEKNSYSLSLENFAIIDNNLAAAQKAIGGSSNLAQIDLTYTYNFDDPKYQDYVCILSVLAQVAIDNAKRRFDIDLNEEIDSIEKDMNIKKNGLPAFWTVTKKDKRKCKNAKERNERRKKQKERIKARVNKDLVCPMNYIYDISVGKFRSNESTLPMEHFFSFYEAPANRRKSKKVEELIQKYSLDLFNYNLGEDDEDEEYLLLRSDYEKLIEDIKKTYISGNYRDLMSWLINRAFRIGSGVKGKSDKIQSTINTNKSLLLKVLYDVNNDIFLQCFSKNLHNKENSTFKKAL